MTLPAHLAPRSVVHGSPLSPTDLQPASGMLEFTRETRLLKASEVVAPNRVVSGESLCHGGLGRDTVAPVGPQRKDSIYRLGAMD
jgi:hypothetical protein